MASVALQFHMAPDEVDSLADDWARRAGLVIASREVKNSLTWIEMTAAGSHHKLVLIVDAVRPDGLRESAFSGETDDPAGLRKFRAFTRAAKSSMHVGATVRNPVSGAFQALPAHRHTAGAHLLAQAGTPMLAAAGWNVYEFADLTDASRDVARR
jgi:hypothetical protein